MIWLVPAMDRLWTEGADGRRRFLDRIALGFDPAHGEAALTYDKAMRERNRLLKEEVADPAWYAALEMQMSAAGARLTAGRRDAISRLDASLASADTSFPKASLSLRRSDGSDDVAEDADQLRAALVRSRPQDMRAGRTLVGPHRSDVHAVFAAKGIPARDASTGEQKALLISLVLASARALRSQGRGTPVLLLDEIAAHLDADRRALLFAEIEALGAQAWMTGTGAELFEAMAPSAARYVVRDEAGRSEVVPA